MAHKTLIKKITEGNKTTYIAKEGTKLGAFFKKLPHGIINKTYTGIGGTSLELDSKRNSIVVEPLKITAYTKSQQPSRTNKYKIHFYGEGTFKKDKQGKLRTTDKTREEVFNSALEDYIKTCKKNKQPIKICCVSDQLRRLYAYLKTAYPKELAKVHLLLDEIDNMQESATFRDVMHDCIEIYKKHDPKKRSLISATLKKFHDPYLHKEPFTEIKYSNASKTDLGIIYIHQVNEGIRNAIINRIEVSPNDKILIALNDVSKCLDAANYLLKHTNLSKSDISILCSKSRRADIKSFTHSFNANGTLSTKVTFITSAYFVGFDIQDSYHNIVVCDAFSSNLRLNPSVIYQITGRCRIKGGLSSNTLLFRKQYDGSSSSEPTVFTAEELIDNDKLLTKIRTFKQDVASFNTAYARHFLELLENGLTTFSNKHKSVFLKNQDTNEIVISYFRIDSIINEQVTASLYRSIELFNNELAEYFNLSVLGAPTSCTKNIQREDSWVVFQNGLTTFGQMSLHDLESKGYEEIKGLAYNTNNRNILKPLVDILKLSHESPFSRAKVMREVEGITDKSPILKDLKNLYIYMLFTTLIEDKNDDSFKKLVEAVYTAESEIEFKSVNNKNKSFLKTIENQAKLYPQNSKLLIFLSLVKSKKNHLHRVLVKTTKRKSNSKTMVAFKSEPLYDLTV